MTKKGIGQQEMVVYSLIAISTIVLFAFAVWYINSLKTGTRGAGCLASMTLKTHTTIESCLAAYSGVGEACPSYDVTFFDKKVEIFKGPKLFQIKKYGELTEEKVNEIVANEMLYCWNQFGAGKLDAFSIARSCLEKAREEGITIFYDESEVIGCRVCSTIQFDEEVDSQEFSNLKEYMKKTTLGNKAKTENKDKTYYDLFAEHKNVCGDNFLEGENCWEEFAKNEEHKIQTDLTINSKKEYLVTLIRDHMNQKEGTMNVYLMTPGTYNRVCESSLPYY